VNEPRLYSMLRTSIVPTILKAGFRVNVIPSEAEATLDVRMLPDDNLDQIYAEMRKVIADPAVKIEHVGGNDRPLAAPSRLDTEMYRALGRASQRLYPGAAVLPIMGTGASDMSQLRAKGVQCYGIGPARTEEDETNYGAHSDVERLSEASLYKLAEFVWDAVTEVAASK
jgi:acetylornithine deacetylase/succinyl-diaminopimelate desuccinylase-like protein